MRVVFMGSAEFACPSIDALIVRPDVNLLAVVTQPEREKGRGRKCARSPVHEHVIGLGLPVLTPERVSSPDFVAELKELHVDLIVIVAYGQILRSNVIELPAKGCVNVHASLLPKYRGAAPIQWAIANGEHTTGVTTMFIVEQLDAGDMIMQAEMRIEDDDTAGLLHGRLAGLGARLLVESLDGIMAGAVSRVRQIDSDATYAARLKKEDGRIDWTMGARRIYDRVRGFNPWPMCWCEAGTGSGHFLRILNVAVEQDDGAGSSACGQILSAEGAGPVVKTGAGAVRLIEVQPEGSRPMDGASYLRGHRLAVEDVLK